MTNKKYINCLTGKEVKMGDIFSAKVVEKNKVATRRIYYKFLINENTLPVLVRKNLIKIIEEKEDVTLKNKVYIKFLAAKWNKTPQETIEALLSLWKLYPLTVLNILYRIVSVMKCKEKNLTLKDIINQDLFYGISFAPYNHVVEILKITRIYVQTDKGAFFSTKKDAEDAMKIVNNLLEYLNLNPSHEREPKN
jgi:hypothetical protein